MTDEQFNELQGMLEELQVEDDDEVLAFGDVCLQYGATKTAKYCAGCSDRNGTAVIGTISNLLSLDVL